METLASLPDPADSAPSPRPSYTFRAAGPSNEEFFAIALRETFYESVEALQSDFDRWLIHYNTERPIRAIATWATAQ